MIDRWTTNYYRYGACLGIVVIFAVAWIILKNTLFQFLTHPLPLAAICAGLTGILASAWLVDLKSRHEITFKQTAFFSAFIFAGGSLIGSIINFLLNGSLLHPDFGLWNEIQDWFVKPLFWLGFIGLPFTQILAAAYFFAYKKALSS